MKALLLEESIVITSSAPGKQYVCTVVCFEDSFMIVLKTLAPTFHVNIDPERGYNFGDKSIAEGVRDIMDSCSTEDELKAKIFELNNQNTTLTIHFSEYKKVKVKGFLGVKTLKASNSALNYVSFNASKDSAKALVEFYSHL